MNSPEMWKSSRNRGTGGNAVVVGEPRQMNAVAGEDVDEGKEPCVYEDGHFITIPIINARQPKTKINVKGAQVVALWDSGATSSYINPKTVEELGLEVIRYPEEVPVRMFDGSESIGGPITKFVETGIRVSIEDEVRMIRLDVTKLCNAEVVIGWEWMKKEGVILDVRKEVIKIPGTQKREEEKLGAVFGFKEGETLGPRDSALEDELSEEEQEELLELVPSEYHGVSSDSVSSPTGRLHLFICGDPHKQDHYSIPERLTSRTNLVPQPLSTGPSNRNTSQIPLLSPDGIIDLSPELLAEDSVATSTKEKFVPLEEQTMSSRATTVIAANRFSVFKLSKVRTSTSSLRSAMISSGVGGGTSSDDNDDEDGVGDGRGGGEGDNSHRGAPGQAVRKETKGGRGGGRPGSLSDDEGDSVANTERRAAGGGRATGEEREVVETFLCLAGEGGRKEQTPDVHDAHRVPRLRSHSSPLGASSHLPGWAARRAKRLAEVLTVPERGTGEEDGASTRARLRAGVGEDKADEEEEDTDIGEEFCRCLFLGDRRMEDFLVKLASFEGVFLFAGVEDGPATGAGGADDEEDTDSEGRAAEREERRRPAELARRRTKDEGGAGGGD
ncbi:hypothetical protein TREMEDRAFT_62579 [Tremella mesenterica DSM 1558]|uniref:uncharacterized protein n=1 Tax=Tremella mesenterica (strain ATCC 24925 / CBS 8224 / DSM 1558 / NBRC 9311 / NRRL Y-6157 / RJB 2259-6 / UBC 559-6) TaxID=578456 RepID=UPI0003F495E6|nr:uncharacterized protein TREMEDRAFT_62579 [Tremella mesenterica DSM 1558]EIW69710.1 hypothetical protein TREMEDRAFT_62579 [Tremella mesenterica DSM 1558]